MPAGIPRADSTGCCFYSRRGWISGIPFLPVFDVDVSILILLCYDHRPQLLHNGIVGKLVAFDHATLFQQTNDIYCVDSSLRDLIEDFFVGFASLR